jgi:hypothetical protein
MNQAIKRAVAELMVENNHSETKLRQVQTKVETQLEAARVKTVMKEFNDKVAEAEAKSEEMGKLIQTDGEKRSAEAAGKVAEEVAALAQVALKILEETKAAIAEKLKEEQSKSGGKLQPTLQKLKSQIVQKEVAIQRQSDTAKQAHTNAVLELGLGEARTAVESAEGELKTALEDIQSLLGSGVDDMAEDRVLQVGGLVEDAAAGCREKNRQGTRAPGRLQAPAAAQVAQHHHGA